MSMVRADLTQPRTPCDVLEYMKEVPDALGLRRENLPTLAVESVKTENLALQGGGVNYTHLLNILVSSVVPLLYNLTLAPLLIIRPAPPLPINVLHTALTSS